MRLFASCGFPSDCLQRVEHRPPLAHCRCCTALSRSHIPSDIRKHELTARHGHGIGSVSFVLVSYVSPGIGDIRHGEGLQNDHCGDHSIATSGPIRR